MHKTGDSVLRCRKNILVPSHSDARLFAAYNGSASRYHLIRNERHAIYPRGLNFSTQHRAAQWDNSVPGYSLLIGHRYSQVVGCLMQPTSYSRPVSWVSSTKLRYHTYHQYGTCSIIYYTQNNVGTTPNQYTRTSIKLSRLEIYLAYLLCCFNEQKSLLSLEPQTFKSLHQQYVAYK